jgi:hypothetical protein
MFELSRLTTGRREVVAWSNTDTERGRRLAHAVDHSLTALPAESANLPPRRTATWNGVTTRLGSPPGSIGGAGDQTAGLLVGG